MDAGLSPPRSCARGKRKEVAQASEQKCAKVCSTGPGLHHRDVCGKDFKCLSCSREHLQTHTGERPPHCKRCAKTFARCADLTKHCLARSAKAPFACHLCPRCLQRLSCLVKHLRVHMPEERFTCTHCPRRFSIGGFGCPHCPDPQPAAQPPQVPAGSSDVLDAPQQASAGSPASP